MMLMSRLPSTFLAKTIRPTMKFTQAIEASIAT
jgi:hypothetical protein